jgi:hypothetical protein
VCPGPARAASATPGLVSARVCTWPFSVAR